MEAFWTILAGSLTATACAILGCYLILRKMAMVGDAISHSVLPGILFAYLLSGGRDPLPMFIGAAAFGVFSTFLIEFFHRVGGVQADAAIGITFTSLFALGVILITVYAGQVDLDQECVLYGEIAYVPLDVWITEGGTNMGPRTVWIMGGVLIFVGLAVAVSYKELFVTTFDAAFAASVGLSVSLWHYLLMTAVSVTSVAAFESVGAILVVALLVVPPATARLLTDSLPKMMGIAVLVGILSSVAGYYIAYFLDGSVAGAMATAAGVFFALAFLFSPTQGILTAKFRSKSADNQPISEPV